MGTRVINCEQIKNIYIRTALYSIIILPVALLGCEAWSLTLKAEKKIGN
jgi:hypothetical protein